MDYLALTLVGLGVGSTYALVALGFSFVVKTTNSFNFSQGTLVSIGGLVTFTVGMQWGVGWAITAIIAIIAMGVIGGLTETIAVAPLIRRGEPPLLWLMSTLGVSVILTGVATRIWGSKPQGVNVYFGDPTVNILGASIQTPYVWAFVVAVVVTAGMVLFERRTRWGRTMRAIADNRDAVRLAGVNTMGYGLAAYAVGAGLSGLAGVILVPITYASINGAFTFTLLGFAAMAIGGFGNHWGALIGGWIVGLVMSVGGGIFGLQFSIGMVFVVLLVILLIRPSGLLAPRNVRTV